MNKSDEYIKTMKGCINMFDGKDPVKQYKEAIESEISEMDEMLYEIDDEFERQSKILPGVSVLEELVKKSGANVPTEGEEYSFKPNNEEMQIGNKVFVVLERPISTKPFTRGKYEFGTIDGIQTLGYNIAKDRTTTSVYSVQMPNGEKEKILSDYSSFGHYYSTIDKEIERNKAELERALQTIAELQQFAEALGYTNLQLENLRNMNKLSQGKELTLAKGENN